MRKYFLLLPCGRFLAACAKSGTGSTTIPEISLDCTTVKCKSALGTYSAVTIISRSGCAPDQVELDPIAVGSIGNMICGSTGCTGTISSWADNNGSPITSMDSNSYYVCSRIDLDRDDLVDVGDEYSELRITIESATTISAVGGDWGVSYFSKGMVADEI